MRPERNKNPLALMEQVLMVLIFSIAAAVCIRAYVISRNLSVQSSNRDEAGRICVSIVETIKACKGEEETIIEGCNLRKQSDCLIGYYDGEFKAVDKEDCEYVVTVNFSEEGLLGRAKVTMKDKAGHAIFALDTAWQEDDNE